MRRLGYDYPGEALFKRLISVHQLRVSAANLPPPFARPGRKYQFDVNVGFASDWGFRLPAAELHRKKAPDPAALPNLRSCHIYMVCRQPLVTIEPNTFLVFNGIASGNLLRHRAGEIEKHRFSFKVDPAVSKGLRVAPYPHRTLIAADANLHWPVTFLSTRLGQNDPSFLDFEVLYIGQSYGQGGNRDAMTRLRKHETLQEILAIGADESPDQEISLLGFSFGAPTVFTITDGSSPLEGDGWDHVRHIIENPLSEEEQINLIEAGLIRYFQPAYNDKFRENFPARGQKLLQSLYTTDIAGITVEVNTEEVHARLWSEARGKGYHHLAKYDLHDPADRQSFFTLTGPDGTVTATLKSGPAF